MAFIPLEVMDKLTNTFVPFLNFMLKFATIKKQMKELILWEIGALH